MTREPGRAAIANSPLDVRERLDLAAGLLAQAVKLLAIREAQPVAALAAVHLAQGILEHIAAQAETVR